MKLLMMTLIAFLLSSVSNAPASSSDGARNNCELSALQINEATALLVIERSPLITEMEINAESDSLLLQLFLWAALEGNNKAIDKVGEIGIKNILERNDDALNRLLWILSQNDDPKGEYSGIAFSPNDVDELNKWANTELKKTPRNIFTAMASKAGRFGGSSPSISEFELIDIKIRDPESLFHMAGLRSGDNEYREAYELLKEAAEGGEWRAFLGLAIIEKSKLQNCAERSQISYHIFSSIKTSTPKKRPD